MHGIITIMNMLEGAVIFIWVTREVFTECIVWTGPLIYRNSKDRKEPEGHSRKMDH